MAWNEKALRGIILSIADKKPNAWRRVQVSCLSRLPAHDQNASACSRDRAPAHATVQAIFSSVHAKEGMPQTPQQVMR